MSADELRDLIFEVLTEHFDGAVPPVFVGLQGNAVVVIQLGDAPHLRVQVVPVQLGVAS